MMTFSTITKGFVALLLVLATIIPSAGQMYKLPFAGGTSRICTQSNGGSKSHTGKEQYAYDFAMPIGTTIVAMRSGTVSMVVQNFTDYNCSSSSCANNVNRVVINHGDGTQSLYLHLTNNGSLVTVGQQVVQGQPIAKSGSTGHSTAPHLHIQVSSTCGIWYCQSTPLSFGDVTGGVPRSGVSYTSDNYPSDVRLTSNLTVSPNPIVQGSPLTVGLSVKNFKGTFSGQIVVALHTVSGTFLGDIDVKNVNLAANATQALSFYKSSMTSAAGSYKLYVKYLATGSTTWVTLPVSTGVNPLSINIIQLITLTVSPTTLPTFSANRGTGIVNVTTNAAIWSVSSNVSWARGAKVGSTVAVSVDANTQTTARSGVITVSAGGLSRQIAVSQAAYVPPAPANDNACGAYSAGINSSFSANTVGATTSPNAPASCYLGTGKDVWFRFVATTTTATITATSGATIALYSGSCSAPSGIACATTKLVKTGLTRNATYYIRVWLPNSATGTIGMGLSSTANATGGTPTEGVAGLSKKLTFGNLTLAPNPASEVLTFSFESDVETAATYQLFDLTGKAVWSEKATLKQDKNAQSIDVSTFTTGIYILNITTEKGETLTQEVSIVR